MIFDLKMAFSIGFDELLDALYFKFEHL